MRPVAAIMEAVKQFEKAFYGWVASGEAVPTPLAHAFDNVEAAPRQAKGD